MKNKKFKIATSIISLAILITPISTLINNSNIANAKTDIQNKNIKANNTFTTTIDLSKIDVENELLKAQQLLKEKKITQEEYSLIKSILKPEINNISSQAKFRAALRAYGPYYPARKVAYINNWGIKEIYNNALPKSKGLSTTISFITGRLIGGPYGWGLGALGLIQSFSGPSAFEQAIQQAYWQGKGIDVYYHISKSIMSLNYVSYVVI
ncbi:hypothetical protein [uncultured Gemella sp.]|uniref:hypothetical protein n=1 Tax=uncultured Gemella sp. TaxID=254352 RepID=UPI0028D1ABB9|nr:hypothetical protein [uncultured Gemella sp.]